VHILGGQHAGGEDILHASLVEGHEHLLGLLEVRIHEGDVHLAILAGHGGVHLGHGALALGLHVGGQHLGVDELGVLVDVVHLEDVVGRGEDHLGLVGEDHRLQHVDHLGDVGHLQAAGVLVEDVEVERGHDGVTHRALLVQVARVRTRLHVEPGAPLVEQQPDLAGRIQLVHDLDVLLEHGLDLDGLGEGPPVLLVGEFGRGALAAGPALAGIVVQGDARHALAFQVLHQDAGPVVVVVGGAAGDLVQAVVALVAQVGAVAAEEVAVVLRRHVAAAAPGLVADAEVFDLPGLLPAVGATQVGHRGLGVGSHVFHPFRHLLDAAAADVAADVRLDAEQLAEVQELVRTEAVVLQGTAPVVVRQVAALLLRADAVHPVVVVGEAAARPAHHGDFQRLESVEHIFAVALDIGHGGVLAYPEAAVDAASEVLGELAVELGGNGLAGAGVVDANGGVLCQQGGGSEQAGACKQGDDFLHIIRYCGCNRYKCTKNFA